MARGSGTPEEAFQLLVRASQRENRKLRDLAADIVDHTVHRQSPSYKNVSPGSPSRLVPRLVLAAG